MPKIASFTIDVVPTVNPADLTAAIRKAEQSAPKLTLKTTVDDASLSTQSGKITAALSKAATIKLKFDTPSLTAELSRLQASLGRGVELKVRVAGGQQAVNDLNTLKSLMANVATNVQYRIAVDATALNAVNTAIQTQITSLQSLITQLRNLGAGSGPAGAPKLPAGVQNTLLEVERLNNLWARGQISVQNYSQALTAMQGRLQTAAQTAGTGTQEFARIDAQITKVTQSLRNLGNGESIGKLRADMASLRATFDSTAGGFSRNSAQFKQAARDYQQGAAQIEARLTALANSGRLTVQQMGQVNNMIARLAREQNTLAGGVNFLGFSGNVANGIGASLNSFLPIIGSLSPSLGAAAMNAGQLANAFGNVASSVGPVGVAIGGAAIAIAGIAVVMNNAVQAAAELQRGMQGITSVAKLTSGEAINLRGNFQKLSTELPVSTEQLTGIARNATLLGVEGSENIQKFTRAVALLGVATRDNNKGFTDLSASAEQIAVFLNETGSTAKTFAKDMDEVVATLAAVDQVTPGTIQGVLNLTKYMAAGAVTLNLSRQEIIGISGALSGLGAKAEAGGSAVIRVLLAMNRSAGGSKKELDSLGESLGITKDELANLFEGQPTAKLDAFARVMGVTSEQAKELIRNNPSQAFLKLADGLKAAHDSGQDFTAILDELGLKNVRDIRLVDQLTVGNQLLAKALDAAANSEKNKAALQERVAKATDNLIDSTTKAKNATVELLQNAGEPLLKFLTGVADGWRDAATSVNEYITSLKGLPAYGAQETSLTTYLKQTGLSSTDFTPDELSKLKDLLSQRQQDENTQARVKNTLSQVGLAGYGLTPAIQDAILRNFRENTAGTRADVTKALAELQRAVSERVLKAVPVGPRGGVDAEGKLVGPAISPREQTVIGQQLVTMLGLAGRKVLNEFGVSGTDYHHNSSIRADATHYGVDYKAPVGTPILAPFNGKISLRSDAGNGNVFELVDSLGNKIVGIHLDQFNAEVKAAFEKAGKKAIDVVQGQVIGTVGKTGNFAGPVAHLHLEAIAAGSTKKVNPASVNFVGFGGDDPALRLPGSATADAINASKSFQQYIAEAKRLTDALNKYSPGGTAPNADKWLKASVALELFTKDNVLAQKAVEWVGPANDKASKFGQTYDKLSKQLSISESVYKLNQNSGDYLKNLDGISKAAEKAANAEKLKNGETAKYKALLDVAGDAAGKAAQQRKAALDSLGQDQERLRALDASVASSNIDVVKAGVAQLKQLRENRLAAESTNAAARLNIERNTQQSILKGEQNLLKLQLDLDKARITGTAASARTDLAKRLGLSDVTKINPKNPELLRINAAETKQLAALQKEYETQSATATITAQKRIIDAQEAVYKKQNQLDKQQADIKKQVTATLAGLDQKALDTRVQAEQDALTKLQSLQKAELDKAGDNAAKRLEIFTRTDKAIQAQAIKTAETVRQTAYGKALKDRNDTVSGLSENATAAQIARVTKAADAQLLKDRQAADRAYNLSVSDAVQATLNAEREANKARLDEQKKFADELSQTQLKSAQATADRLKLLDDAQVEAAGENLVKRAALTKKFAEEEYQRQKAINLAAQKAVIDAATGPNKAQIISGAQAQYLLDDAKAQQTRADAVKKAEADVTQSVRQTRDSYSQLATALREKISAGKVDQHTLTDTFKAMGDLQKATDKAGTSTNQYVVGARNSSQALYQLAIDSAVAAGAFDGLDHSGKIVAATQGDYNEAIQQAIDLMPQTEDGLNAYISLLSDMEKTGQAAAGSVKAVTDEIKRQRDLLAEDQANDFIGDPSTNTIGTGGDFSSIMDGAKDINGKIKPFESQVEKISDLLDQLPTDLDALDNFEAGLEQMAANGDLTAKSLQALKAAIQGVRDAAGPHNELLTDNLEGRGLAINVTPDVKTDAAYGAVSEEGKEALKVGLSEATADVLNDILDDLFSKGLDKSIFAEMIRSELASRDDISKIIDDVTNNPATFADGSRGTGGVQPGGKDTISDETIAERIDALGTDLKKIQDFEKALDSLAGENKITPEQLEKFKAVTAALKEIQGSFKEMLPDNLQERGLGENVIPTAATDPAFGAVSDEQRADLQKAISAATSETLADIMENLGQGGGDSPLAQMIRDEINSRVDVDNLAAQIAETPGDYADGSRGSDRTPLPNPQESTLDFAGIMEGIKKNRLTKDQVMQLLGDPSFTKEQVAEAKAYLLSSQQDLLDTERAKTAAHLEILKQMGLVSEREYLRQKEALDVDAADAAFTRATINLDPNDDAYIQAAANREQAITAIHEKGIADRAGLDDQVSRALDTLASQAQLADLEQQHNKFLISDQDFIDQRQQLQENAAAQQYFNDLQDMKDGELAWAEYQAKLTQIQQEADAARAQTPIGTLTKQIHDLNEGFKNGSTTGTDFFSGATKVIQQAERMAKAAEKAGNPELAKQFREQAEAVMELGGAALNAYMKLNTFSEWAQAISEVGGAFAGLAGAMGETEQEYDSLTGAKLQTPWKDLAANLQGVSKAFNTLQSIASSVMGIIASGGTDIGSWAKLAVTVISSVTDAISGFKKAKAEVSKNVSDFTQQNPFLNAADYQKTFTRSRGWFADIFGGGPEVVNEIDNIGLTFAKTIADAFKNGITNGLKQGLAQNDMSLFTKSLKEAVGDAILQGIVDSFLQGEAIKAILAPAIKAYTDSLKGIGSKDAAIQGIENATEAVIDLGNSFTKDLAPSLEKLRAGGYLGVGAPPGSLAALDSQVSALQTKLQNATSQAERLSIQSQIDALNQQKALLTPGSGAGLTSSGININASDNLVKGLTSGQVTLNFDALPAFSNALTVMSTSSIPLFDLSTKRFDAAVTRLLAGIPGPPPAPTPPRIVAPV